MISIEHVRLEDVPFIDLQPQGDEANEDGIVNEPVIIDTRTGKPYREPRQTEMTGQTKAMQAPPKLPEGVTWDDVEIIPDEDPDADKRFEDETVFVARNKKTGEIYR